MVKCYEEVNIFDGQRVAFGFARPRVTVPLSTSTERLAQPQDGACRVTCRVTTCRVTALRGLLALTGTVPLSTSTERLACPRTVPLSTSTERLARPNLEIFR